MDLLTTSDLLSKDQYERERPDLRRRVMLQKDRRRVAVGPHCTLHFENRDTMRYQVLEMLRAEGTWNNASAVADELHAYNPLIPQTGELSATLMLEYETPEERVHELPRFVGLDRHVWLLVGDTNPAQATFDRGQIDEHKISAVQYVKWHLTTDQRRLLKTDGTVLRLVIDHPHYQAQAVLSEETRRAIMHDPD